MKKEKDNYLLKYYNTLKFIKTLTILIGLINLIGFILSINGIYNEITRSWNYLIITGLNVLIAGKGLSSVLYKEELIRRGN